LDGERIAEADAELIRLKSAGLSFGQIAKQMNVTRNAAISRFQRINGKIYGHSRWALRLRQQAEAELSANVGPNVRQSCTGKPRSCGKNSRL
jgi:hypothetical protein